jgi:tripartite-type tricarboxylate transporter receptor subunit TctC
LPSLLALYSGTLNAPSRFQTILVDGKLVRSLHAICSSISIAVRERTAAKEAPMQHILAYRSRRQFAKGLYALTAVPALLMLGASPAIAQAYPAKPVRIIVPFAAGGSADTLIRQLTPLLAEGWGQPIVVDARPGATGSIGADFVARQAADGYTLLMTSSAFSTSPALNLNLPYDIFRDFSPIVGVSNAPQLLIVHPSLPVRSVKDFVAFAKQRPGELGWASGGIGSTGHLAGAVFSELVGIRLFHVPYKSNPFANTDVMAGHVPLMFDQLSTAAPHVRAGKVRALAITSGRRNALLPDVPTMAEAGFAQIQTSIWQGLLGPSGVPRDVVTRVNGDVNRVLALPDIRERLAKLGLDVFGGSPEALAARIKSELTTARNVVKATGVKAE